MIETRPPDMPLVLHWMGRAMFWLTGWRTQGHIPNCPKLVIVAAPHTSNLDGLLMFPAGWIFRVRLRWIGKHTLFRLPLGWLLRALGGVPVDRGAPRGAVQQMIQAFESAERMVLIIAPEGTRKKAERWKTGFYHIAQGAGVPVLLAYVDYRRRVIGAGPVIQPSGDLDADLRIIQQFYADKTARYPDQVTLPLGN